MAEDAKDSGEERVLVPVAADMLRERCAREQGDKGPAAGLGGFRDQSPLSA